MSKENARERSELQRAIEAILFAAGEPVGIARMADAIGCAAAYAFGPALLPLI